MTSAVGSAPARRAGEGAASARHVAIIGAGRVGTAVARSLIDAGYEVSLSGSGAASDVAMIASIVAPGAQARGVADAVQDADLVVLAVPLHRVEELDAHLFDGAVVMDATNYWPPVDGRVAAFDGAEHGSSAVVQRLLPGARVVKTLNHVGYHDLEPDRRPPGSTERRAMAAAGDDPAALALVAELIDRIGYDPVVLDSLESGRLLEPGTAAFGARLTAPELVEATSRRHTTGA